MKRIILFLCCSVATVLLYGCGPMQMPMPVRLDDEGQKNLDQSWDKALTPVNRFDHPTLLDAFLLTQAYQVGVDKLSFHSEKNVELGTVIMDIEYDRRKPDGDRFEVKLVDPAGKLLREETYYREEVVRANDELFKQDSDLQRAVAEGRATPAQVKELAALQARIDAVTAIFPKDDPNALKVKEKQP
jgi:hypothetical protein